MGFNDSTIQCSKLVDLEYSGSKSNFMALAGVVLFLHSELAENGAVNLASSLGATVTHTATQTVHAIVSDTVTGHQYLAVTKCNPKAMIVRTSWLRACAGEGAKVSFDGHQLMSLEGCKISITGTMEPAQREQLAKNIKASGAEFSADMKRDCTHLIALSSTQPKYKYAQSWGLLTVSPSWLDACLKLGVRQDESQHPVQASSQSTQPASNGASAGAVDAPAGSGRSITLAQGVASGTGRTGSSLSDAAARGRPSSKPAQAAPVPNKPAMSAFAAAAPDPVTGDWLFLDWVRYHGVGMTTEEAVQVRQLAAHGGAVREMTLSPSVTHVIVGSQPAAAELSQVKEHWMNWREHVRVVKLQWLCECVAKRRSLEPVEPSLLFPLAGVPTRTSVLPEPSGLSTAPSTSTGIPAWLGPANTSVDFCDLASLDTRSRATDGSGLQQAAAPAVQERKLNSEGGSALEGLWFTLAAVPHDKELSKLVRQHGGQVFTAESLRKVRDLSQAFALCPAGLHPHTVQELEKTAADFRGTPANHRVTGYWLESCLGSGRLLDPAQPSLVLYRPLPFEVPLPALTAETKIHVSGIMNKNTKRHIIKLLNVLGATVTDNFCATNTHLLLPELPSKPSRPVSATEQALTKYDVALKYGAIMINEEWVMQMARTGRVPDAWESRFRPNKETIEQREKSRKALAQRLQPPLLGNSNSSSRGVGMSTQLGPTQVSTQGGASQAGTASKSVCYTSATGFRLTALDAARQGNEEEQGAAAKPLAARQAHPSGIPAPAPSQQHHPPKQVLQPVTATAADQQPAGSSNSRGGVGQTASFELNPPAAPGSSGSRQQLASNASHAAQDSGSRRAPAAVQPDGPGSNGSEQAVVGSRQGTAAACTVPVLPGQQMDACSRDCSASAPAAPQMGNAASGQQEQANTCIQPEAHVPDAGDEDLADLHTSIQALIQTHGRGTAGNTDLNSTHADPPPPGPCTSGLPAVSGGFSGAGPEPSRSSGGASGLLGSLGQQGGDVSSKPAISGIRKPSKRQAGGLNSLGRGLKAGRVTRSSNNSNPELELEMSQQVGYDASQRPDERLLRSRASAAGHSTHHGADQSAAKQDFISKVLRTRGQLG